MWRVLINPSPISANILNHTGELWGLHSNGLNYPVQWLKSVDTLLGKHKDSSINRTGRIYRGNSGKDPSAFVGLIGRSVRMDISLLWDLIRKKKKTFLILRTALAIDRAVNKFTYSEPQVSRDFHHFLLSCWLYKYTVHHLLCLYYWTPETLFSSLNVSLFHFWSIVHLGLVSLMLHSLYSLRILHCNLTVLRRCLSVVPLQKMLLESWLPLKYRLTWEHVTSRYLAF